MRPWGEFGIANRVKTLSDLYKEGLGLLVFLCDVLHVTFGFFQIKYFVP